MPGDRISAGEVVLVTAAASVQFGGNRRLLLRVLKVDAKPTYYGWCWLTGYVLDPATGDAVDKREIFVQPAGLRRLTGAPRVAAPARRLVGAARLV